MSKKIHTIQSSDKVEFDNKVNFFLEFGCELHYGGYEVIKNDDGVAYSQVIVFKNCEVEFYENGKLKSVRNKNEDGERDGLQTSWYSDGQKEIEWTWKDGKKEGLFIKWYENGQKNSEETYKDGEEGLSTWWYKNGQKWREETHKDGYIISVKRWYRDGTEQ